MKLSDLKEVALTHREYDSATTKTLSKLRSLFNVNELVALAKDSPYLQDQAKLDDAIRSTLERMNIDPHFKSGVIQRIKKVLGVA